MERDRAVKMMMLLDIKQNPVVPPECYGIISICLDRMFQVGYEQARSDFSHQTPIGRYSKDGILLDVYPSIVFAANMYGVTRINIQKVARGKKGSRTAGGYIWKYVDEATAKENMWYKKLIEGVGKIEEQNRLLDSEIIPETNVDELPTCNT